MAGRLYSSDRPYGVREAGELECPSGEAELRLLIPPSLAMHDHIPNVENISRVAAQSVETRDNKLFAGPEEGSNARP